MAILADVGGGEGCGVVGRVESRFQQSDIYGTQA
jgi:hypothetical protein